MIFSCITCKKDIDDVPSSKRKFCSILCRNNNSDYKEVLKSAGKKSALEGRSGNKNPNWRGGTCGKRHLLMSSNAYKEWRKAVYDRDGYKCVECGEQGNGKNLNADHIKPYSTHPELALDIDNGRTLCIPCHKATDTYGWKMFNKLRKMENVCLA